MIYGHHHFVCEMCGEDCVTDDDTLDDFGAIAQGDEVGAVCHDCFLKMGDMFRALPADRQAAIRAEAESRGETVPW